MNPTDVEREADAIFQAAQALSGEETTRLIREAIAPNYGLVSGDPIVRAEGPWLYARSGRRIFDGVAAYSAANLGHGHPLVRAVLHRFLDSHAPPVLGRFLGDPWLALFGQTIVRMTGFQRFLPANGGVEGPEAAIKLARRWAHRVKGVAGDPEILYAEGCFHGRTTTVTQMFGEDEQEARDGFGPWTPGFRRIPYDDIAAMEAAMNDRTAAVLIEPIQGEGGVNVPKDGYLRDVVALCRRKRVLAIFDEVQTGWARTGELFCWMNEGPEARPDIMAIGKSVSGGYAPVAGILADSELMELLGPGAHGSTFGGCPISSAIGYASLVAIEKEDLVRRAKETGPWLRARLEEIAARSPRIAAIRGRGMMFGIQLTEEDPDGDALSKELFARGALIKSTHRWVLRFTPPIVASREDLEVALQILAQTFAEGA